MDIEKTMEFILEQQASFEAQMSSLAQQQRESALRHDKEMAELRAGMSELRAGMSEFRDGMADFRAEMSGLREELQRAVHAGIEEQRRERARRHELDERTSSSIKELRDSIQELSVMQKVTEEKLQKLIDRS